MKGTFGLGHTQPPSKQSETRPSQFIITTDIIKELQLDWGLSNRVRMMNHICDLAKTKTFEEWRQSAGSSIQSLPHGFLHQPASALASPRFSASPVGLSALVSPCSCSRFQPPRPCSPPWHPPSHFPTPFPIFPNKVSCAELCVWVRSVLTITGTCKTLHTRQGVSGKQPLPPVLCRQQICVV